MSGRFSACSGETIPDAMRERFGANFFVVTLLIFLGVSVIVLAAEIGGIAAALEMATGWALPVWSIPVALLAWGLLWRGTFGFIENGVSLLGLVTIAFAVGAAKMHPDYHAVARGVLPSLPTHDRAHYWFVAVSVLGASITPSLYYFYSSGAIEDKWDTGYIGVNKAIAADRRPGFGGFLSLAVLWILGALVFHPRGIEVDHHRQLPELLSGVSRKNGLLACSSLASLAITRAWARPSRSPLSLARLHDRRSGFWLDVERGRRAEGQCTFQRDL